MVCERGVETGDEWRRRLRNRPLRAGGNEDAEVLSEWESRKQSIHHRFSGQGTIQVSMTFDIISTREKGAKGLQSRLEELDDPVKGQRAETSRISQQEYVARLRQLNDDISHAWMASDRINALKLAIQGGRHTSVHPPQFQEVCRTFNSTDSFISHNTTTIVWPAYEHAYVYSSYTYPQ